MNCFLMISANWLFTLITLFVVLLDYHTDLLLLPSRDSSQCENYFPNEIWATFVTMTVNCWLYLVRMQSMKPLMTVHRLSLLVWHSPLLIYTRWLTVLALLTVDELIATLNHHLPLFLLSSSTVLLLSTRLHSELTAAKPAGRALIKNAIDRLRPVSPCIDRRKTGEWENEG